MGYDFFYPQKRIIVNSMVHNCPWGSLGDDHPYDEELSMDREYWK